MQVPAWLAEYCESTYLLARFCPPQAVGWRGGRLWEQCAYDAMETTGVRARQGPGSLTLFGRGSASGLAHELDGAGAGDGWTFVCEAKAYSRRGPSKADVFYFDRKTFDLYLEGRRAGAPGFHWRALVSATPVADELRRYCYLHGIVVVDPALIPLPMLVRMAARPNADLYFQDSVLAELVRLGELACGPLESRYAPDGPHNLRFDLEVMIAEELDDLLWLQRTVSEDLLELVDEEQPGYFESRAEEIISRFGIRISGYNAKWAASA